MAVLDWAPEQYLQFKQERTQPSLDLVARISLEDPESIIDIGCGPGNSTRILRERWPHAEIIGIDKSEKMIGRARADYPDQTWIIGDAASLETDRTFDLVFSNAVIHWIPDHESLLRRLFKLVNKRGILAIQVPANQESPLYKIIIKIARSARWSPSTSGREQLITYHNAEYYYNLLVSRTREIALWETTYHHILNSHQELIEWYRSTAMKPYLDSLRNDGERAHFEKEVLDECKAYYPLQSDGRILYPFKRLFFTARNSGNGKK